MKEDYSDSSSFYMNQRSHFSYYQDFYKDWCLMESFNTYFSTNIELFKNKIILDIGCGPGYFDMLLIRNGAKHVYAYEPSGMSLYLADNIKQNDMEDFITVLSGDLENVNIAEDIDVIITTAIGYSYFFETLYFSYLKAIDLFYRDGSLILPSNVKFYMTCHGIMNNNLEYTEWKNEYGFDYSVISNGLRDPILCCLDPNNVLSDQQEVYKLDFEKKDQNVKSFAFNASLTANRTDDAYGLCMWFTVEYPSKKSKLLVSTDPCQPETHFYQISFPFKNKVKIRKGERIDVSLNITLENFNCRPINYNLSYKTQYESTENIMYSLR